MNDGSEYRLRHEHGWPWRKVAERTGAPSAQAAKDRAWRWADYSGAPWPIVSPALTPIGERCYCVAARMAGDKGWPPEWTDVASLAGSSSGSAARRGAEQCARRRGWVWPAKLDHKGRPVVAGGEG